LRGRERLCALAVPPRNQDGLTQSLSGLPTGARPLQRGALMARYLLLRLGDAIPTPFLVLTLVFIAMRILPGDPALAALGDAALLAPLAEFRERIGLNVPLWQQYFNFLGGVLTLDFGRSLLSNTPVLTLIAQNLPYTIEL